MQTSFQTIDYSILVLYFGIMVAVGAWFARYEGSTERFFLGNRCLPWWAVGISIFATQLSAITYIAIPGKAYETDWAWLVYNLGIPIVGVFVIYFLLPVYRRREITSINELLEERFGPETRAYGALAYILMQIGRVAIVLYLPSLALAQVTGLSIYWMIVVMGILVTIYTVLGGIEVVIWTDVVQTIVLLFGALLALGLICIEVEGGLFGVISKGMEQDKFRMIHTDPSVSKDLIWFMLLGAFFTNLVPYASDQTVVQRYFTTASDQQARRCLWLSVLITIPTSFLFFFLGTSLFVFYNIHPDLMTIDLAKQGYDRVFPFFIVNQMPAGVSGLLIAAIFAGAMSSLDSSINSIATVCTTDFYKRFMRPDSTDRQRLNLARCITIVVGILATILALWVAQTLSGSPDDKGAWDLFIAVQGLLGGVLAGIFCVGVFTKKANQIGVVAALVVGTAFLSVVKFDRQWHPQTFAATGIIVTFIVCYLFSLITTQRKAKG